MQTLEPLRAVIVSWSLLVGPFLLNHAQPTLTLLQVMTSTSQSTMRRATASRSGCSKKIKKKGSGGTYRAFVRLRSRGTQGKPNLRNIAREYREALEGGECHGLLELARELGAHATLSGRTAPQKRSSFGVSLQDVRRRVEVTTMRALSRSLEGLALQEQTERILAFASLHGEVGSNAIALSKRVMRLQAAAKKEEEDQNHETLQRFQDTLGKEQVVMAKARLPRVSADLRAVPAGDLLLFEVSNSTTVEEAVQCCAWTSSNRASNIGKSLSECWEKQHIMVGASAVAGPPRARAKLTKCQQAGVCLCTPAGQLLRKKLSR